MKYPTGDLIFQHTYEPLGGCVYEEKLTPPTPRPPPIFSLAVFRAASPPAEHLEQAYEWAMILNNAFRFLIGRKLQNRKIIK